MRAVRMRVLVAIALVAALLTLDAGPPADAVSFLCAPGEDDWTTEINKFPPHQLPPGGSQPAAIKLQYIGGFPGAVFTWTKAQPDVDVRAIYVAGRSVPLSPQRIRTPSNDNRWYPVVFCLGQQPRPGLSLTKTSTSHPDGNGDGVADTPITAPGPISYVLAATNTGNVALTDVQIIDPTVSFGPCTPAQPAVLAAGATLRCTASRTVDLPTIASGGSVRNTAAAEGVHQGRRYTAVSSYAIPIANQPAIQIEKTSTNFPDGDGDGIADAPLTGPATVNYELTITNTGNVTLTDLAVSDPDLGAVTCGAGTPTSIAPGASFTCAGSQTLAQADLDGVGDIKNVASASGRGGGSTVTDRDVYDIPVRQIVSITATKTSTSHPDADGDGSADRPAEADEVIDYVVTVENTGNVSVALAVTDSITTLTCAATTLAPAATTSCTGAYAVTQTDIDAFHPIQNTATVTATGSTGTDTKIAGYLVPVLDVSALTVRKTSTSHPPAQPADHVSGTGVTSAPTNVTFDIDIENTGTTTITGIEVFDLVAVTCPHGTPFDLGPGDMVTCASSVTVLQTDLDNEPGIVNIAVAVGTDASGASVAGGDLFVVPFVRRPALDLSKSARAPFGDADGNGIADTPISAPQSVTYDLVATNTGNVTLDDVEITDGTLGALSCDLAAPVSLAPGATVRCTGTRAVTQAQIDSGLPVANAAFVTSNGAEFDRAAYVLLVDGRPDLRFTKTSTSHPDADDDGTADAPITATGAVDYLLTVENTGDVTLFGVTVSDPLLPSLTCGPVTLAPAATLTCDETDGATYVVSQQEIDAGVDLLNTATVDATDFHGDAIQGQAFYDIPIGQATGLELTKIARAPFGDADGNGIADAPISAPQSVTYDLVATNTGNVTLGDVAITDATLGALTCDLAAPVSLAPGASVRCTGTRAVGQAQIDSGLPVVNAAFVTSNGVVLDRAAYVINVRRSPGIRVTKTSTSNPDTDGDGIADTPLTSTGPVTYRIDVQNIGNTTLTNVVIDDPLLNGCTAFPVGTLAPAELASCTGTFGVSQQLLDNGGDLVNTADATALAGGRLLTDQDTFDIPIDRRPALTVTKSALAPFDDTDGNGTADASAVADDDIDYVVTVANTGNVTIDSITAADTIAALTCATDTLAPGASTSCTGRYTVTQSDVDALTPLQNVATVTGVSPSGQTVPAGAAYLVPVLGRPELLVRKSIPANPDTDGDFVADTPMTGPAIVGYEIAIANAGTVTLSDVAVADSLLASIRCPGGTPLGLAVGAVVTCTGSFEVTQAIFDAEPGLVNIAVAAGAAPGGAQVAGGWIAAVEFDHQPELTLAKTSTSHPDADGDGIADVPLTGPDTVDYQLVATNTGNVTLADVTVTDPLLPSLSCTVAALAPGDSLTCGGSLAVGQGVVDGGGDLLNRATATATFDGATLTDRASYDVPISTVSSLTLAKTSTSQPDADGDGVADAPVTSPGSIAYRLTATNSGNTTLTEVVIADPAIAGLSCDAATPARLAPGEVLVCTGTAAVSQGDLDAGAATVNTATATARSATEGEITTDDVYTVPLERRPDLVVSKLPATLTSTAGEQTTLRWTIELRNVGNVTLTDVVLADVLVTGGTGDVEALPSCSTTLASLAPGASNTVECQVIRTMSENQVANLAIVEGDSLAGPVVGGAFALVDVQVLAPNVPTPAPTLPGSGLPGTGGDTGALAWALGLLALGAAALAAGKVRRPST